MHSSGDKRDSNANTQTGKTENPSTPDSGKELCEDGRILQGVDDKLIGDDLEIREAEDEHLHTGKELPKNNENY